MEAPKSIAHEIGGVKNDALRFGLHGVKSNIIGSHPLESSYQSVISLTPLSLFDKLKLTYAYNCFLYSPLVLSTIFIRKFKYYFFFFFFGAASVEIIGIT